MSTTHPWFAELVAGGAALLYGIAAFVLLAALFRRAFFQLLWQRRQELLASAAGTADPAGVSRQARGRLQRAVLFMPVHVGLTIEALVGSLGVLAEPLVRPAWAERMRGKFMAMGRPDYAPQDFRVRQLVYAVVLGSFGFLFMMLLGRSWAARLLAGVCFGLGGFVLPYIWLRDQIAKRHRAIQRALPYHLDLMTLGLEAGLDFAQGLATVVERGQRGPLLEELGIVVSEMKLGKTREEALRNMADRVQLTEVTSFVSTLIQAARMGTSLGKVLRIQSGQMRVARAQQAEKAANEAPVKMLVPLVLCFFPTMFMILFGPIIYRVMYGG